MAFATASPLLLSLSGVAALARVERPTVSVWRSRASASDEPFPAPVLTDPQHLFDGEEVARWLASTGRGRNPDAAADLAVVAALESWRGPERGTALQGLTALLALAASTGERLAGLSASDVIDLADDTDPHDLMLYSELEALGTDIPALAAHADRMTDAAYTATAALEALLRQHGGDGVPLFPLPGVTPAAAELVARLAAALVAPGTADTTTIADPHGCADVLVSMRALLPEEASPSVAVDLTGSTPEARLYRRRLVAHGWRLVALGRDEDGRLVLPGAGVTVAVLPFQSTSARDPGGTLDLLDDLALALGPADQAIVLGPVGPLVGALPSPATRDVRDALLRADRVRTMARLPSGLVTGSPRQGAALWVLGAARDQAPVAERRVTVADLSATPLDVGAMEDLATDVVSAVTDPRNARRHAFRFARSVPTRELLATTGDLVGAPRPRAPRPSEAPVETALRVRELLDAVNGAGLGALAIEVGHQEGATARLVTLGELLARRVARLVPGHRLREEDVTGARADGGVTVVGVPELVGHRPVGERTVDRLTFSAAYPAARYTEPGDVVFCSTPGVGALVDSDGLSVVQYPARILRLAPGARGVAPRLLARDIASAPPRTLWRTWPVHVVPADATAALDDALGRVATEQRWTAERLAALDALAALLSQGVASGVLTLDSPTPDPLNHHDDPMNEEG